MDLCAGPAPLSRLAACWALRCEAFLPAPLCRALTAGVYRGRPEWIASFDETQFSLGRAFYTDLEEDRTAAYFADAAASDRAVRRHAPGLQERLLSALTLLLGPRAQLRQRPGWCGPGVHIFPAGGWVAQNGGEVHFDIEGLPDPARDARAPALTLVLVLQAPAEGGGLRVWDLRFDGRDHPAAPPGPRHVPSATVPYAPGDLIVLDSYRLHQIEPFAGPSDRVTATVHALRVAGPAGPAAGADPEIWEAWF